MTKQELRKLYLEKRRNLTDGECSDLNLKLYNYFFASLDLSFIHVLHLYLPIEGKREPDTWMILDRLRREFPHVRISIPRIGAVGELENIFFEGPHQLQINAMGIQEPKQGVPTLVEKIDLVIVPLLSFDRQGYRVGYGKGYYDRFLRLCRPDCKKIGLSFFPYVEHIDIDSHDVRLDGCVTPTGTNFF